MKANPSGGSAFDWLFLAMAHQRLGRNDEARRWLERAGAFVELLEQGEAPADGNLGRPLSWQDRLEFMIVHREAAALIAGAQN